LLTLFVTPWAKGRVLAWDLAQWLLWRMWACSPHRSKVAGIRPVACSPHWPRQLPLASLTANSLACPHVEVAGSSLVVCFGLGWDTRLCRVWSFRCI
jgi:hypothetical protein